jgi:hypothetical protein
VSAALAQFANCETSNSFQFANSEISTLLVHEDQNPEIISLEQAFTIKKDPENP